MIFNLMNIYIFALYKFSPLRMSGVVEPTKMGEMKGYFKNEK